MNIVLDWIKDFVDVPDSLSDGRIAERITLSVCEVENYERPLEILGNVRVARVLAVELHPNAEKLKLATVDLGGGEKTQVVCGAPNCREGIYVPYAAVGTRLPDGVKLEAKEIRGVVSRGMLCSGAELGISEDGAGLMELGADSPVGERLSEVSGVSTGGLVLEIDNKSLTHRPDLWGHYGMAREFAAVFGLNMKRNLDEKWKSDIRLKMVQSRNAKFGVSGGGRGSSKTSPSPISLEISPDSCNLGFLCLCIDGIEVGQSPEWMQIRLRMAGMRPINSVVDVSNYVMLEMGIPSHIFDRETIRGRKIVVRRAGRKQEFKTLDGEVRVLEPGDTLVCDSVGPSAIAGIMGGQDSSVSESTRNIAVEVANWRDSEIRRTSTRLGLRTDASQRYEKSLDSQFLELALMRIYDLIVQMNPDAVAIDAIQMANMPVLPECVINTSAERISSILGHEVDEDRVVEILKSLGFGIERSSALVNLRVAVPSWRAAKDVEVEVDIVEEIGRIIGYDNIVPQSPHEDIGVSALPMTKRIIRRAQDYLVLRARALEIMNYPLTGNALMERVGWPYRNENLVLANAITPEYDRMRQSLVPGLIEAASRNAREHDEFRFFELGRSYGADFFVDGDDGLRSGEDFSEERQQIGVLFYGSRENPFTELSNVIEGLLCWLDVKDAEVRLAEVNQAGAFYLLPPDWHGTHPHEVLRIHVKDIPRGVIFSLHPQMARKFKMNGRIAIAVLDITDISEDDRHSSVRFRKLDRFPGNVFDLTVVVPVHQYAAEVLRVIEKLGIPEIRHLGILDMFLLEEAKALTLRVEFRSSERTLETEFISAAQQRIVTELKNAGYPLRGY